MSEPHRCPVCYGTGSLPSPYPMTTAGMIQVTCHACNGKGIVWEQSHPIKHILVAKENPLEPRNLERLDRERAMSETPRPMSESVLIEAERLTTGARQESYGHPADDYAKVAQMWSAILGTEVTPQQAIMCMICIKISRELNLPSRDNRVDMAGYANCLDMVEYRLSGDELHEENAKIAECLRVMEQNAKTVSRGKLKEDNPT